jgi:hypothetical protein
MNRERAETYLRVLAEAEIRRATTQSGDDASRAGYGARVKRVAGNYFGPASYWTGSTSNAGCLGAMARI